MTTFKGFIMMSSILAGRRSFCIFVKNCMEMVSFVGISVRKNDGIGNVIPMKGISIYVILTAKKKRKKDVIMNNSRQMNILCFRISNS